MNTKYKNKFSEKSKVLSIRVPESRHSQIKKNVNGFIELLLKDKTISFSILKEGINDSQQFTNDIQKHFKFYKSLKRHDFYKIQRLQLDPLIKKLQKCKKILN